MRKTFSKAAVCVATCLILAGCGGSPASTPAADESQAEQTTQTSATSADEQAQGIDYLALVNKLNPLPDGWEDSLETVHMTNSVGDDVEVEKKAYDAYLELKAALEEEGVHVDLDSAYRSIAAQQKIMDDFTQKYGADYAKKTVATPGYSEHQTGLALDLYLNIDGKDIVMNEDPEKLRERFPLYFDTVVVDAPCSGEGMFRKEEEAVPNWSPENVGMCARRQEGILDCAAQMTAPGGTLVYSTCTFAPMENERNAGLFLKRHPDFVIEDLPAQLGEEFMERTGLSAGVPEYAEEAEIPEEIRESLRGSIRLWPHRLEGEGHYLAVFRKSGSPLKRRGAAAKPLRDKEAMRLWNEFCKETLTKSGAELLRTDGTEGAVLTLFGKELYRVPESVSLDGLKILRPGLHLGTLKKNRFEPSHALALALGSEDVRCAAEISDPEEKVYGDGRHACAYLRGESLRARDCAQITGNKGWCLVTDRGYSCGWGKLSADQIKNHYPKGLRRPY